LERQVLGGVPPVIIGADSEAIRECSYNKCSLVRGFSSQALQQSFDKRSCLTLLILDAVKHGWPASSRMDAYQSCLCIAPIQLDLFRTRVHLYIRPPVSALFHHSSATRLPGPISEPQSLSRPLEAAELPINTTEGPGF